MGSSLSQHPSCPYYYVPENMPARRALNKLVQRYVGRTTNPKAGTARMSFGQYEDAAGWVRQHFHLLNPCRASSLLDLLPVLQYAPGRLDCRVE